MNLSTHNHPLKILHIASGDLWAGAEVQLYTLCSQLIRNNKLSVSVILMNEGELASKLRSLHIEVIIFDESRLSFPQLLRGVISYCNSNQPNLIHSHRFKENIIAGLCRLRLGIPSIRTVHGASETTVKTLSINKFLGYLNLLTGRYLQQQVVAVSNDLRLKLLGSYKASHLSTIRNGVDFSAIDQAPEKNLEPNPGTTIFKIGIVGRLTAVKRIDLFLKMAAILTQHDREISLRFYIIGDGPLKESAGNMTNTLGISNVVRFLGHVSPAISHIKNLDLLVMCSDHEGTPMTLLEAMRCKTPIIAHDVGGLRELLNQDCGYLVDNHTAQGYSEAIETLLTAPDKVRQLASNAFSRVSDIYSSEANAEHYFDLYQRFSK